MRTHFLTALCVVLLFGLFTSIAHPADEEFVGILALTVDPDVAKEIGLSPKLQAELQSLIDQREADALEMALTMRDKSEAEQASELAEFRQESERQGLRLLDDTMRSGLQSIQLRRAGFSSLADPKVAQKLNLSDAQQQQVTQLLAKRKAALSKVAGAKTVTVRKNYERQLKAILSNEQIDDWAVITRTNKVASASAPGGTMAAVGNTSKATSTRNTVGNSGRLQFSFRYAPWRTVIEWFADQCDLSLLMDAPPQGTFNYTDPRDYSQAQAIDLLNSVLLTKGYTLIRREKMLQVVNLEDGIPPNLVPEVTEQELDELGEYELVRCLFTLRRVNADEAQAEIERLLGPQGAVNVLTSSNQLAVTETAGRLRTFRQILQRGEIQNASTLGQAKVVSLKHVRASKIIASWRKLMGLTDEDNVAPDGSLRVTQGKNSLELIVSGQPQNVSEFEGLVRILDVASGLGPRDVPQLEVYSVTEADPESVLSVLDTLLEDADDVRLATDPKSGNLVALARPDDQATIRAVIDQLEADRRQVEVIRLRSIDPQLAMLSIEKLFGPTGADEDGTEAKNAPVVDADPVTRSLLIEGPKIRSKISVRCLKNWGRTNRHARAARLDRTVASFG